jgi:ATP-binding cassette subfamily C (CFTR/MRP) protein 1
MDEATASVDGESDILIQNSIQKYFGDSTVISIAHRINTIVGFDKVLVLDHGQLAEFDSPRNLLSNRDSLFYQLAEATGSSNLEHLKSMTKR